MGKRYEALHGGGWVATSKKSVTYFMGGPLFVERLDITAD